ncbi:Thaumatin-like protein 1 [Acorus calamus]|uniref:Thaumatin-like protein 1 n=1 Tax=Acorus calamus TaxID=4465 RepID=A0AAV9CPM9_ACOCL|nr:Thaumatin-like protein 1 [Acorus calamus]
MAKSVFVAFVFAFLVIGVKSTTFTFTNNCPYTVWPGTQSGSGSPALSQTGFQLNNGATTSLDASPGWSGRFWARTRCGSDSSGKFTCATGDCGSGQVQCNGAGGAPPATLVEFTLGSGGSQDFYDTSLVDGFNLPVSVVPQGGSGCKTSSCPADVNGLCPAELKVVGSDGATVACKSACEAFGSPQYCCTGSFGTPQTCPPTDYSRIFSNACPLAYSYAYDDLRGTFTCTGANYLITFCP